MTVSLSTSPFLPLPTVLLFLCANPIRSVPEVGRHIEAIREVAKFDNLVEWSSDPREKAALL